MIAAEQEESLEWRAAVIPSEASLISYTITYVYVCTMYVDERRTERVRKKSNHLCCQRTGLNCNSLAYVLFYYRLRT